MIDIGIDTSHQLVYKSALRFKDPRGRFSQRNSKLY